MNVEIPAPGSRGVAVVKKTDSGVEIVEVHIYSPNGKHLTMNGSFFPDRYPDASSARQDVSKALNNSPVQTVVLDDIQ